MWVRSHKNYTKLPEQSRKPSNTYLVLPGFLRWLGIIASIPEVRLSIFSLEKGDFCSVALQKSEGEVLNKMKPTNPNAHTYVNGTDIKTHGYAVTHNIFLQ